VVEFFHVWPEGGTPQQTTPLSFALARGQQDPLIARSVVPEQQRALFDPSTFVGSQHLDPSAVWILPVALQQVEFTLLRRERLQQE
jgi:hypothetical protein